MELSTKVVRSVSNFTCKSVIYSPKSFLKYTENEHFLSFKWMLRGGIEIDSLLKLNISFFSSPYSIVYP